MATLTPEQKAALIHLQSKRSTTKQLLGRTRIAVKIQATMPPPSRTFLHQSIYKLIAHIESIDSSIAAILGEPHE